jgi:hypothetical protein
LSATESSISDAIKQRRTFIEDLATAIEQEAAESIHGITFGLEYGFDDNSRRIIEQLNVKENTDFIQANKVNLEIIRQKADKFLADIYAKKQKVLSRHDEKTVAKDILSLTEKILFNAEMEGDKIGGFFESTMTAGKRALFALAISRYL